MKKHVQEYLIFALVVLFHSYIRIRSIENLTTVSAGSLYSSWSPGNSAGFHDSFHRNQNLTAEIRRWALEEFSLFGLQDLI